MKTAMLLHGSGGSDQDYFWFADTQKYLEDHGYQVWWPLLPNTDKPNLGETEAFVKANWPDIGEETIIIGHSSACPLILHLLRNLRAKIGQVILVSGYYVPQTDGPSSMLPTRFEWDVVKNKASEIILINSDNDPWGCNDEQARPVAKRLGAKFVLAEGQGHMGSSTFKQPYKELPLLKELLRTEI